jgi:hypothetical protein
VLDVFRITLCNRCFSALSAEQQAAAMLSTVRRAVRICQWQQKQQQQGDGCSNTYGSLPQQCRYAIDVSMPSAQLLTECLLLVPTADMASGCLQLLTPLMQQVNAALQLARDEGDSDASQQLTEGISIITQTAFQQMGPAVCHCGKQTSDLKQRRQLLRLWADAVAVLMQADTGKVQLLQLANCKPAEINTGALAVSGLTSVLAIMLSSI